MELKPIIGDNITRPEVKLTNPTGRVTLVLQTAASIMAQLPTLTVDMTLESIHGSPREICKNVPLWDIAFYAQHGEGSIHEKEVSAGNFELTLTIKLCKLGYALDLSSDNYLRMTFSPIANGKSMRVFYHEGGIPTNSVIGYKRMSIPADELTRRQVLPSGALNAIMPTDGTNLEEIKLTTSGPYPATYRRPVYLIEAENQIFNDIVATCHAANGSFNMITPMHATSTVVSLEGMVSIETELSSEGGYKWTLVELITL